MNQSPGFSENDLRTVAVAMRLLQSRGMTTYDAATQINGRWEYRAPNTVESLTKEIS